MQLDILVFGAHPDDLEIGCYGTLAQIIKSGGFVDLFVATGCRERIQESIKAAKHLGDKNYKVHTLKYKNNEIPYNSNIIQDIDSRLVEINPDLVITHWVGDNQQDHQNLAKAVISACRKRDSIWMMEPPHGRPPVEGVFRPQVYVDISETVGRKEAAILEHHSQFSRLSLNNSFNPWIGKSRLHGLSTNTSAAEAFEVVKFTIKKF